MAMVFLMSNAKAQHELVGVLVDRYPEVIYGIGEVARTGFPLHDEAVPAPNNHQIRRRHPLQTDATVRLLKDGKTKFFTQVEMQRGYSLGKLTTLRAYHGSEVRNSRCGGHLFVLSPKETVARSFRESDALMREMLAYHADYLSGADLARLGESGRAFAERALAAAVTDFEDGIPVSAVRMVGEMQERDEPLLADMLVKAMMEECADPVQVEEALASELAMERLAGLPSVQKIVEQARAADREKARAEAARLEEKARAEVARRETEIRAEALREYFAAKGDAPTADALARISACADPDVIQNWLLRAYRGETAAEIFPDE